LESSFTNPKVQAMIPSNPAQAAVAILRLYIKKGCSKAECWASGSGNEGGSPKQKGKKSGNGKDKSGKKAGL
jgi:hypothetical protein